MAAAKKKPAKKAAKKPVVSAQAAAKRKAGKNGRTDSVNRDARCRVFAAAWLQYGNQVRAYREAVPESTSNDVTARKEAWLLFHDERTQKCIDELRAAACRRTEATLSEWIANELRLTRFDPARLRDHKGNLLPLDEIDPDTRYCIESVEFEEEQVEVTKLGETEIVRRTRVKKIKAHSKHQAQDRLGKYLGAYERDNEQKSASYEEVLRALHGQPDNG